MFNDRELVRQHGHWDPELGAYWVEDPDDDKKRYFTWRKPPMFIDAIFLCLYLLFWVGVAAVVFLIFFQWPQGVVGGRPAQLAAVLNERYRASVSYLPEHWTPSQVFTVNVEQGWDEPDYEEPPVTLKGCRLQPGADSFELSLQCPDSSGNFDDVPLGGQSAKDDRIEKALEKNPLWSSTVPGDDESSSYDPSEEYMPGPSDIYEPPTPEDYYP